MAGGFAGPVLCSPSTAELAAVVLRDAAHLQEEDARHANRAGYSKHQPALPLFDVAAAEKAIGLLHPVPFGERRPIEGAAVTLRRAGHILGSATVTVEAGDRVVTFSGDLGGGDHPLLVPPDAPPASDAIVVESTYGDRSHGVRDLNGIADAIGRTLSGGGTVLVPAFAVDRTAVLLLTLRQLMEQRRVPAVPVYVDSPMALAALDIYREAVRAGAPDLRRTLSRDPFDAGGLHLVHSAEESARLNHPDRPCILISASGMATGGRVVHHLAALAPEARNLILLPGFQVPGTRGRALADGATAIKAFGGYIPVRAAVVATDAFSCHADADHILGWLRRTPHPPRTCYVVHGQAAAATALAQRIHGELGWTAVVPEPGERVKV